MVKKTCVRVLKSCAIDVNSFSQKEVILLDREGERVEEKNIYINSKRKEEF